MRIWRRCSRPSWTSPAWGMGKSVKLETKHRSDSSHVKHRYMYKEVDCMVILKVVDLYKMDMLLFQYSAEQYLEEAGVIC